MGHVQPVPEALVGVNPEGRGSLTVTVVPLVAPPLLVTVKVKLPVPPRTKVEALDVFETTRLAG